MFLYLTVGDPISLILLSSGTTLVVVSKSSNLVAPPTFNVCLIPAPPRTCNAPLLIVELVVVSLTIT